MYNNISQHCVTPRYFIATSFKPKHILRRSLAEIVRFLYSGVRRLKAHLQYSVEKLQHVGRRIVNFLFSLLHKIFGIQHHPLHTATARQVRNQSAGNRPAQRHSDVEQVTLPHYMQVIEAQLPKEWGMLVARLTKEPQHYRLYLGLRVAIEELNASVLHLLLVGNIYAAVGPSPEPLSKQLYYYYKHCLSLQKDIIEKLLVLQAWAKEWKKSGHLEEEIDCIKDNLVEEFQYFMRIDLVSHRYENLEKYVCKTSLLHNFFAILPTNTPHPPLPRVAIPQTLFEEIAVFFNQQYSALDADFHTGFQKDKNPHRNFSIYCVTLKLMVKHFQAHWLMHALTPANAEEAYKTLLVEFQALFHYFIWMQEMLIALNASLPLNEQSDDILLQPEYLQQSTLAFCTFEKTDITNYFSTIDQYSEEVQLLCHTLIQKKALNFDR